jgi:hypothetical protein
VQQFVITLITPLEDISRRDRERERIRAPTRGSFVPSELKRTRVNFLLEKAFFNSVRIPRNKSIGRSARERERAKRVAWDYFVRR